MKKLVVGGCSYSSGFGLEKNQKSWPEVVSNKCGYELTNLSEAGTSIQYSIHKIINHILENETDVVILQLTTLDRYPIPINGEEKFLTNDITSKNNEVPELFHLLVANYLEAVDGENFGIGSNIVRYFNEKVMYSDFYLKTLINELIMLQDFLNVRNIKLICVTYDDYFWGEESNMSIWKYPYSKNLKFNSFINESFMTWFKKHYNPDDYFIDKGFHLSEEGHRIFGEEYFLKHINI